MQNTCRFNHLLDPALRSIPYILQSHVFKAYCALESIYAQKPHLPQKVWDHCETLIRDDEPKVAGIIAPKLLELKEIVDPTSGRDFGPDWILGRGLMPLSYWAMQKKIDDVGFRNVFQHYVKQALDHPKFLGHEISVLAGHWQFYQDVIAKSSNPEHQALFTQRFTEFATTTFAQGNDTVFDHPEIDRTPPSSEILKEALHNPDFFGHNVLAFVWAHRLKPLMNEVQYETTLHHLTLLNRWDQPQHVDPLKEDWSEETFEEHFIAFFSEGPTNIHQVTLAEALLGVWTHHPDNRRLVAANLLCFTEGTQPKGLASKT